MSDRPTDAEIEAMRRAQPGWQWSDQVTAVLDEVLAARTMIEVLRALLVALAVSVPSSMEIDGYDGDADWVIRDTIRLIDAAELSS